VNIVEPVLKRRYQRYLWLKAHRTSKFNTEEPSTPYATPALPISPASHTRTQSLEIVVLPSSPSRPQQQQSQATMAFRDPARQAEYLASQWQGSSQGSGRLPADNLGHRSPHGSHPSPTGGRIQRGPHGLQPLPHGGLQPSTNGIQNGNSSFLDSRTSQRGRGQEDLFGHVRVPPHGGHNQSSLQRIVQSQRSAYPTGTLFQPPPILHHQDTVK